MLNRFISFVRQKLLYRRLLESVHQEPRHQRLSLCSLQVDSLRSRGSNVGSLLVDHSNAREKLELKARYWLALLSGPIEMRRARSNKCFSRTLAAVERPKWFVEQRAERSRPGDSCWLLTPPGTMAMANGRARVPQSSHADGSCRWHQPGDRSIRHDARSRGNAFPLRHCSCSLDRPPSSMSARKSGEAVRTSAKSRLP